MTHRPGAMAPGLPLLPQRWDHDCRAPLPSLPIPGLVISAGKRAT